MDSPNMDQGNMGLPDYTAPPFQPFSSDLFHPTFVETSSMNYYETNQFGNWNSVQSQPDVVPLEPELVPVAAPANPSSQRGRKPKLSEDEKKANKRNSDIKHRAKKKQRMDVLEKENRRLTGTVRELNSENQNLKREITRLNYFADKVKADIQGQRENVGKIKDYQDISLSDQDYLSSGSDMLKDTKLLKLIESGLIPDEIKESFTKGPAPGTSGCCQSAPCHIFEAPVLAFIRKLDADEESNVDSGDFTDLKGHEKQNHSIVGKYKIPNCLVPTALRIGQVFGDVCASSKINPRTGETSYVLFCAAVKEMNEVPLENVTEEKMVIWRDAIQDALRISFKVEFAMKHLKKIARGYFGLKAVYKENYESLNLDGKILKLEAQMNGLKEYKACIDIANEFRGKSVGDGLWS